MSKPQNPAASERRIDLDWVRIGAFGLLIFYHVGMLYVSWGFHIKSAHRLAWLEPVMLLVNPWRLPLLFLVSGVATRFMLGKYDRLSLLRTRSARLLIPLTFGVLVIVPPQAYVQVVESVGYPSGFIDFYLHHYLAGAVQFCPGPCIMLPNWNHLWFLPYLWVYTAVLIGALAVWPLFGRRLGAALAVLLSGPWLLILPCLLFVSWRLFLYPAFPATYALLGDWYNHADFATAFLIGFLLAKEEGIWSELERLRWLSVGLAAGSFAVFILLRAGVTGTLVSLPTLKIIVGSAYGFYQWLVMAAVLGQARHLVTADGPVRRYLTDAMFPYYIAHQTALIMIAHALQGNGLSAGQEACIVFGGTVAACVVSYEIVRRIAWLRPLFGLRMRPSPSLKAVQRPA